MPRLLGVCAGALVVFPPYLVLARAAAEAAPTLATGPGARLATALAIHFAANGPATPGALVVLAAAVALAAMTVAAYAVASQAIRARLASWRPDPHRPTPLPPSRAECAARAFLAGMTGALDLGAWTLIPYGWIPGLVTGALPILAAFPAVARDRRYQAALGWGAWGMPMTWPATAVGAALFIVNLGPALAACGRQAVRLDPGTGTIECWAGLTGITGHVGGFNLGNFAFVTPGARPTPFDAPGLSAHETGHTLNAAAFGWIFHLINAIDENVPPLARGRLAYAELAAESHRPRTGRPWVDLWSG